MKTGGEPAARSPESDMSDVSSPHLPTLRWATPQLISVRIPYNAGINQNCELAPQAKRRLV